MFHGHHLGSHYLQRFNLPLEMRLIFSDKNNFIISSCHSVTALSKIEKQLELQAGLQFFSFSKCLKIAYLLSVSKRSFACLKSFGIYTCVTGTIANTIFFMLHCELSVRMSKMVNSDTVFQTHHRL